MSRTQPFRTLRPTGSPSAGGGVHTLAAHMADSSPHPQYVRKGDSVGDSNLTGHEASVMAHVKNYLLRQEVASSVNEYVASTNTQNAGGAFDQNLVSTIRTVVSPWLINQLFNTADGLTHFPLISSRTDVVTTFDGRHIDGGSGKVTGWEVFQQLASYVEKLYFGGRDKLPTDHPWHVATDDSANKGGNPLAQIFSVIGHTHTEYARVRHSHDFSDIHDPFDPTVIAARSDHTHSQYLTEEDLDRFGITFDPEDLRRVGIWESAVEAPSPIENTDVTPSDDEVSVRDLNRYSVQGNYTFQISAREIRAGGTDWAQKTHFPRAYVTAVDSLIAPSEKFSYLTTRMLGIVSTGILNVTSVTGSGVVFGTTDLTKYLVDFTSSHVHTLVNQTLYVDTPVDKFDIDNTPNDVKPFGGYVNSHKDIVRKTYTRTGYSLNSAWYISSITGIVSRSPESFAGDVDSDATTIARIANYFNLAAGSGVPISDEYSGLSIGYYRYPDNSNVAGYADKFRLDPRFAAFEPSITKIVPWNGVIDSDVNDFGGQHYIDWYKSRIGCAVDATRWLIPGCMSRSTATLATDPYSYAESVRYIDTLEALSSKNDDVYLPYLEYFESKTKSEAVVVTTAADGTSPCTTVIDVSNSYFDLSDLEIPISTSSNVSTNKDACVRIDMTSKEKVYAGNNDVGYPAIIRDGEDVMSLSNVLHEFSLYQEPTYKDGYVYATLVPGGMSSNGAYVFTLIDVTPGDAVSGTVYSALRVTSGSDYDRMWAKKLVLRNASDPYDVTKRYYAYNPATHAFDDITEGIRQYVSIQGTTYIPYDNRGTEYLHPIFTDLEPATKEMVKAKVTPEPSQYVVPLIPSDKRIFLHGVSYVKIRAGYNPEFATQQTAHLSEAITTGFYASGTSRVQVAHIINDSGDPIKADGVEVASASVLTDYIDVQVVTPTPVPVDAEYDSTVVYLTIGYGGSLRRTTTMSATSFPNRVQTEKLFTIPKDTDTTEYKYPNESLTGADANLYGVKLPRYEKMLSKVINPTSAAGAEPNPVYLRGFFYRTVDAEAIKGKRYFAHREYDIYDTATQSDWSDGNVYECIDINTFFDVWCAIRRLTSEGSEVFLSSKNIVYNFGSDGNLVVWDAWQTTVTDANTDFVDFVVRLDKFRFAVDTFLPDMYSAMTNVGYTHNSSATVANPRSVGLTNLWNAIKWFNAAGHPLTESTASILCTFTTAEDSDGVYWTRGSDDANTSASTHAIVENQDKKNWRLSHNGVKLANFDDLARKAGVKWVSSLETRIGDLEEVYDWIKTAIPGGGSLVIDSSVTDYDIDPFLERSSARSVVKLSDKNVSYKILDISENGYKPYQFSIVLKSDSGARVIEDPIAELLVIEPVEGGDPVTKGAIHVPASSLLWVVTSGTNHGVYFRVPDHWVNLYGMSGTAKVYLRVRYYGSSSSGIGSIIK